MTNTRILITPLVDRPFYGSVSNWSAGPAWPGGGGCAVLLL